MGTESTAIKHDDWDTLWSEYSRAADYNPAVAYRRRIIRRLLEIDPHQTGVRMLEMGSGTGQFASEFCPQFPGVNYLGLDMSAEGVQQAKIRVPAARFAVCNLLQPVVTDEVLSFGATHALCSEVLEHVDDPESLLRNSGSGMANGCRLIVTVPGGPMTEFDKHIGHRKHFTSKQLELILIKAGFEVIKSTGIGFPFFNLYRLVLLSRGKGLVQLVSGSPSNLIRLGYYIFNALNCLNVDFGGWQIVAVARWQGSSS